MEGSAHGDCSHSHQSENESQAANEVQVKKFIFLIFHSGYRWE